MSAQLSENDDLVLGPVGGLLAGLVSGGLVLNLFIPRSGLEFDGASPWLPWAAAAVLGLLYGACQLRVPTRGLVAVAVFYGVFLWVLTNIFGWILFPQTAAALRSWPGFFAFEFYTLILGVVAVFMAKLRGHGKEEARH